MITEEQLESMRRWPAAHMLEARYVDFITFLNGGNFFSGLQLLAGFHEWLDGRLQDSPSNLGWPLRVARHSGATNHFRELSESEDKAAVEALFSLLTEFAKEART